MSSLFAGTANPLGWPTELIVLGSGPQRGAPNEGLSESSEPGLGRLGPAIRIKIETV